MDTNKPTSMKPLPPSTEVVDVETFSFTPISHKGTTKSTAISVEHYAPNRNLYLIDLSNSDDDENNDVTILNSKPQNTPFGSKRKRNSENGESSNFNTIKPFTCDICTETKTSNDMFRISGCSHSYCTVCVVMYVSSKLQENVVIIRCPETECVGLLKVQDCREILPKEVFDRWGNALCEAVILDTEKLYCPFKDCSALLIDDGGEVVKECECPYCRRMFCVRCKVAWHDGIVCEEFQKLNKDEREKEDIMLMQLASSKNWMRCPKCRFYVERSEGCFYMKCRCGHTFCYNCGALFSSDDDTHYCSKPRS